MVMYEGQKRPDLWNIAGWAAVAICVVLAAASLVGMFLFIRPAFVLTVVLCAVSGLSWWLPNRSLRAELEAARERLVAFNGSESREALAEAKPVLYDQDAERTYSLDEVIADGGFTQAEIDAADDEDHQDAGAVWCVRVDQGGSPWCALLDNREPTIGETEVETLCGWMGDVSTGLEYRQPTCVECVAFCRDDEDEEDDAPPPRDVYSFLDHPDELNAWGSAIHADDDTSSTGPRSVPGPGRID